MTNLVNKVQLFGSVLEKPTTKDLNGKIMTIVQLKTVEVWTNTAGVTVEEVQTHRLIGFGKMGQAMQKWIPNTTKLVEGRIHYKDKKYDDVLTTVCEIIVRDFL